MSRRNAEIHLVLEKVMASTLRQNNHLNGFRGVQDFWIHCLVDSGVFRWKKRFGELMFEA
jgi:hypothetical protein